VPSRCKIQSSVQSEPIIIPNTFANLRLPDHRGGVFDFERAMQSPPLLVVFIRGHWCPYCRRYLCKLQQHLPRIRETGAKVVVISPEPQATSAAMAQQLRVAIPILSDSDGKAIELFGVRNGFASAFVSGRSLMPHPAVYILGKAGIVQFRSIDRNYKKRTSVRTILNALRAPSQE